MGAYRKSMGEGLNLWDLVLDADLVGEFGSDELVVSAE